MNYYDILLAKKLEDDRDPRVEGLSVTENGRYEEDGVVYKPVIVSVAPPEDSYQLKSITTPTSLATFEASEMPMPSLKVSVEAKQEGSGVPSPENVRPISGWSEVVVNVSGINLFDKNSISAGKNVNNQGVEVEVINSCCSDYIPVLPNTNYYAVKVKAVQTYYSSAIYDKNKTFLRNVSLSGAGIQNGIINTGDDAAYIKINTNNDNVSGTMLVFGNIAPSDYIPFIGLTTTTISLPQTVYGGEVDVVNGILKITDGYIASYNGETLPSTWISSMDEYAEGTSPTTGAEVVYTLASSTTVSLTPTLIKSLEGTNNLSVDSGEVIEGEYFKAL